MLFTLNPNKAQDVRDNYPLRVMVMWVVFAIHVTTIGWQGVVPPWFWVVIIFHTLIQPHLAYSFASGRHHENYNLIFDVFMGEKNLQFVVFDIDFLPKYWQYCFKFV